MLSTILVAGLAAAGLASVIRALMPLRWVVFKPWSCDLCMSFHGSWLTILALDAAEGRAALAGTWAAHWAVGTLGGVAVGMVALKVIKLLRKQLDGEPEATT